MDEHGPHKKSSNLSTRVGIVALVGLVVYLGSQVMGSGLLQRGTAAPSFQLRLAHGGDGELRLADLEGQVVVLDFWSTSCPPCLKTMAELEVVAERFRKEGVQIIGVAVGGEDADEVQRFGEQRRVSYKLAVGDDLLADAYRVRVLPSLYVLSRNGTVVESHSGYWDKAGIARAVRSALDQPALKN